MSTAEVVLETTAGRDENITDLIRGVGTKYVLARTFIIIYNVHNTS